MGYSRFLRITNLESETEALRAVQYALLVDPRLRHGFNTYPTGVFIVGAVAAVPLRRSTALFRRRLRHRPHADAREILVGLEKIVAGALHDF